MSKKSTAAKKIKIKKVRLTSKNLKFFEILKNVREKKIKIENFRFSKSNFTNVFFLKTENVRIFSSIFLLQKWKYYIFIFFVQHFLVAVHIF